MSDTPIKISTDLSKILERIEDKIDNLQKDVNGKSDNLQKDVNGKFDNLQKDVNDLKVGQAKLEEKVEGLSKRIDNQEFVSRGVLIGLILAIAGGAAKLFGFIGNP
ncbi:MAG TPA: hypothetical protein ACFCUY_01950 [Xenococcaceae cyanobacterium]